MSQKSKLLPRFVNAVLVAWLIVSAAVFAGAMTLEMIFAAAVTLVISYFVLRRQRWGYFAAAAWGLAGYQLAKEGLALEVVKRAAMLGGFAVVVVAIYLHEVYCRRPDEREESEPR